MDNQTAKNILMWGTEDGKSTGKPASHATIVSAHDLIYGPSGSTTQAATDSHAGDPPIQPPYQPPPLFANSQSQADNLIPGVFSSQPYIIRLNYDIYVHDINARNYADWYGGAGSGIDYADAYATWRKNFVEIGIAVDPPPPPARRVPMTLGAYEKWWVANSDNNMREPPQGVVAPFQMARPPLISRYDFVAAVQIKATDMANQSAEVPSLGSLEWQGPTPAAQS